MMALAARRSAGARAAARRSARHRPGAASAACTVVVVGAAVGDRRDRVLVLTGAELRRRARRSPRRGRTALTHPRHRPPVVVGGPLRGRRRRAARFTTANEIHIPVGRPVADQARARADVIHSFWVPNLHGKHGPDPGPARTQLRLAADRPGIYRGQCAEFCGLQHAHMGFLVVAEPPGDFERWRDAQIAAGRAAERSGAAGAGETVFLARPCVMCHTVRGTPAGGRVGARPDPRRQPPHARRRHAAEDAAATSRPGSSTRRASSRAPHMPAIQLEPDDVQRRRRLPGGPASERAPRAAPDEPRPARHRRLDGAELRARLADGPGAPAAGLIGWLSTRRPQDHRPALHRHRLRLPRSSAGCSRC